MTFGMGLADLGSWDAYRIHAGEWERILPPWAWWIAAAATVGFLLAFVLTTLFSLLYMPLLNTRPVPGERRCRPFGTLLIAAAVPVGLTSGLVLRTVTHGFG